MAKAAVEKATAISNAKIQFVSLVDKAANRRQFLLKKEQDGKATFTAYGRIVKADSENHYVTGVVYEPMTEDSHGNYMSEEEITKAAYYFAKNGDKVDIQHSFEPFDGATVVETWIAKADFKICDEEIRKGTWLMTMEIADADVWEKIEKGEITGFSMGGVGEYSEEDVDLDNVEKTEWKADKKGLLKQLASALGLNVVEKGAMQEIYEERSKGSLFWNAMNTLEEVLYSYDNITGRWRYESDEGRVRECLEEFSQIITSILTGGESITKALQDGRPEPVEKAGKKMSSKNRETLAGIYESLGTFLKEFDDPEQDPEKADEEKEQKEEKEVTKQEVEAIVAKSIEAAIAKVSGAGTGNTGAVAEGTGEAGNVEKSEQTGAQVTPESIDAMVQEAIEKALAPQHEEPHLTAEQVQDMITKAVGDAVAPLLKSRGLPTNLNNSGVEKSAGEEHYLHGIL